MKKRIKTIFIILIFLAGLSLLLYPLASNQWNSYRQSRLMTNYEKQVEQAVSEGKIDYGEEWAQAHTYNQDLLPSILPDAFAMAEAAEAEGVVDGAYWSALNLTGDGMMGYVEIPKIAVRIPIYHGTDEETLQNAAGHLEGSSLPVGGESTHAVISAHRGLPSATLFTDLDQLKEEDHFFLNILDDTLAYEVDQIKVVEPNDTSALVVEDGQDLVTLMTCTPYGVNSHRLLVRGHRVPYEVAEIEEEQSVPLAGGVSLRTNYALWVVVGLIVTGVFILILYLRERRLRRRHKNRRGADT